MKKKENKNQNEHFNIMTKDIYLHIRNDFQHFFIHKPLWGIFTFIILQNSSNKSTF